MLEGPFCGGGHGAGDEERSTGEVVEDIGFPVPGRVAGLECAEQGFSVYEELRGVRGVGVCEVDDHGSGGDACEVEGEEEFEGEGGGLGVEFGEVVGLLVEVGVPAAVVDCEGVDAGFFGEGDVLGVVIVEGL